MRFPSIAAVGVSFWEFSSVSVLLLGTVGFVVLPSRSMSASGGAGSGTPFCLLSSYGSLVRNSSGSATELGSILAEGDVVSGFSSRYS